MGGGDKKDVDDAVALALSKLQPIASNLGFGSVCGFTSGYAAKKIGKMAAFASGCCFMFLQGLAYSGVIEIKWAYIEKKMEQAADVDKNGKVDMKDAISLWNKTIKPMLTFHLPHAAGFSVGFLTGVRYG